MMYGPCESVSALRFAFYSVSLAPQDKSLSREERVRERADCARRLRAAGIDPEKMPENIDEFRNQFARSLHIFVNKWEGCPKRICQRQRGCMAPDNTCCNIEKISTEEFYHQWPKLQFAIRTALNETLAKYGAVDD